MIEQFDVVDAHDVPIGVLKVKPEAHEQGLLHRCVAVFVFDAAGLLYVQHHKSGLLDHSVGGHVSAGEGYDVSAQREGEEELNLYNQKLVRIATGFHSDELFDPANQSSNHQHMFGIYECHPTEDWTFEPNEEVAAIHPESLENVVDQMNATPGRFTPGFINVMGEYIRLKSLPLELNLEECRRNWASTR